MEKSNEPLVGIAIPVYNGAQFIRECLDHIIDQTYTNWICVVTDNNSNDGTYEIVLDYVRNNARFKVFRNAKTTTPWENFNIAYNNLNDVCNPKYSIEFPADDWMFPTCLEKKVNMLETHHDVGMSLSYSICGSEVIYGGVLDYEKGEIFNGRELLHDYLKHDSYMVGNLGTPMYRVDALRKINPHLRVYNEKNIHCDVELANDVLRDWNVGMIYEILNYYRIHEGQGLTFARRFNTDLYGHEVEFQKHMDLFDDLEKEYQQHRIDYALFLLKMRRENKTDVIAWHEKYLVEHLHKPITKSEYRRAIVRYSKRAINSSWSAFLSFWDVLFLYRYRKKMNVDNDLHELRQQSYI